MRFDYDTAAVVQFADGTTVRARELRDQLPLVVAMGGDAILIGEDTFANVTGLALPLRGKSRYAIDGYIAYASGATPDIAFILDGPGDVWTGMYGVAALDPPATGGVGNVEMRSFPLTPAVRFAVAGTDSGATLACFPNMYIDTTGRWATLQIRFAQNVLDASVSSVKAGSWLKATKIS